MKIRRPRNQEAELDITSFMNLMIILVPVLLMSMVFSHITVLDIKLPDLASGDPLNKPEKQALELVVRKDYIDVNYPAGIRLKRIPTLASPEKNGESGGAIGGGSSGESGGESSEESDEMSDRASPKHHDMKMLSLVLQEVKRGLKEKGIEKRDILVLLEAETDYQAIVSVMDTARSFKAVVVTDVVNAELFPVISMGDAPVSVTEVPE